MHLTVQSELLANQDIEETSGNPALTRAVRSPLLAELHGDVEGRAHLVHRTRHSGFRIAASVEHRVTGAAAPISTTVDPDRACTVIGCRPESRRGRCGSSRSSAYACSAERRRMPSGTRATRLSTPRWGHGWAGLVSRSAAAPRRLLDVRRRGRRR